MTPLFAQAMNDADQHYYETDDCYTRHIEAKYRERTVWHDRQPGGAPARMYIGDERCHFFSVASGDNIGPPGVMKAFLRGDTEQGGSPALNPINALDVPEFVDRAARLRKLDAQGVDKCLMLPSTGVGVEPQLAMPKHREVLYPTLRAFNRWVEEDWGYGVDGRIFAAPLMSLQDLDQGVEELDRVIALGARFVLVTCGPVGGHSPGEPYFDPFWARCQEAGVNVVFHIGSTYVQAPYNQAWGLRPIPPSHRNSLMEYMLSFTERPVVDMLTALLADNVFGRFPGLRVLSVEYGSAWVGSLLHKLHHVSRLFSKDMWRFGAPPERPDELIRRHLWVSPFFEDDVPALAELIGAQRVLAGSDYPHPEGLAEPLELLDELEGLPAPDVQLIMRDNFEALLAPPAV